MKHRHEIKFSIDKSVEINGVTLDGEEILTVAFRYIPAQPETRTDPSVEDDIEILSVLDASGVDSEVRVKDADLDRIKDACWEHVQEAASCG